MESRDAGTIKALVELGLLKPSIPPALNDLAKQLDKYEQEIGRLDPESLTKYLVKSG